MWLSVEKVISNALATLSSSSIFRFPSSVVRERMVGGFAAVAPPALQYTGRLLQAFLVEYVTRTVAGQRVFRGVHLESEAQHDVEGGRIVAVAARVSEHRLLVELAAIRLGT